MGNLQSQQPAENDLDKLEAMLQETLAGMENQVKVISSSKFTGYSKDKTVSISVLGTCMIEDPEKDIQFGAPALEGGLKAFKQRVGEALQDAIERVQTFMRQEFEGLTQNMPKGIRELMTDETKE